MDFNEQEKGNKIQIPEAVLSYINKIVNKLVLYVKNNISNLELLWEKLTSLDKYISESFVQKNNINIFCKTQTSSIYDYNIEKNPIEKYKIAKLQRQLKQQHDQFQLKELAYLERLAVLQNEFLKTESNIKENSKEENLFNSSHKKKSSFLINELDNSIKHKILNNTAGNLNKNRTNKFDIKLDTPTHLNIKNKIMLLAFANNKRYEDNIQNTTNNFYQTGNKKNNNSVNKSVVDHNKINEEIMARTRFESIFKIKGKKNRKNSEGSAIRHDFSEIKKSIEEGKKKIILLRNSIVPKVYSKMPLK